MVHSTFPKEHFKVELIFFEITKKIFPSEIGRKRCHFSTTKYSEWFSKLPCSSPGEQFERNDFVRKTLIFVVSFGSWARTFRQSYQKTGLLWQDNNLGKWFSLQLIWFLKMFSHFDQKFPDFGRNFSRKMSICLFRVKMNNILQHIFFVEQTKGFKSI